ncbi:MAG: diphthine--ammonia ligase [Candidatus Pacearchaeota archaeon]|jgi:ABC transporter with metal-binding/Fe-S-binding domain ATP-binding protein
MKDKTQKMTNKKSNKIKMKCGVLFSGGKDSCYAAYLAKKEGYELTCLISLISENKESYMFHTPSISKVEYQAKNMDIPIIMQSTKGKKELELEDLKKAIKKAIKKYKINCIVTGAIESVYQASRIQKICDELNLECFNPLWQRNQIEYLKELVKNKFEVIIIGVFAYPLDESWLGRKIDEKFIEDVKKLQVKYKINPAGEGGEFETFVLNCPLFKKPLEIKSIEASGEKNSHKIEIELG